MKNELKRIRTEAKEGIKKKCKSFEPIKFPQLGDADQDEEVIEDDSVTVSVKTLGVDDLAKKNNWIGSNKGFVVESESESEEETPDAGEIPGMGLSVKKEKKSKKVEEAPTKKYESKKDIDKEMKKKMFKALKKNKALKAKTREKRSKDIQVSRRVKHFKEKTKKTKTAFRKKSK